MHCRTALSMNDLLGMMDRNGPNGADLGTSVLTEFLGFSEKDEVVFVSRLKPLETEVLGFYCHFFFPTRIQKLTASHTAGSLILPTCFSEVCLPEVFLK